MLLTELRKLVHYRELIRTLVLRQIKIRYRVLALGYLWTIIEPLVTMFVLSFVIGTLLKARTENFSAYLLSGLIPWMFFSGSVSKSTMSLIGNAGLIKKVYFPREILVFSTVIVHFVNFLLSFIAFVPLMILLKITPTSHLFFLPVSMLVLFILSLGLALILACVNVYYRETETLVRFVLQTTFFLTPIFYSIENRIPEHFHTLYLTLNPLAVIIMSFRSALLGGAFPAPKYILITSVVSGMVFFIGYWLFKKEENEAVKRI
jgi:ABC-type polysaccharide/polyol phosphate export permease